MRKRLEQHEIAVWWATPVEMRSAFERLLRMGQLTIQDHSAAGARLEILRRGWRELQPTDALRTEAEIFLSSYPLKAADALQLAAAWIWCSGNAQNCTFISGDTQLLEAARHLGFQTVTLGTTHRTSP
jgi:predicted nucleic acid-binding protein